MAAPPTAATTPRPDQTFDIVVAPVNDEPSFTTPGNQTVDEDSGPHTVAGFATPAAGGGADECGADASRYTVSNDNAGAVRGRRRRSTPARQLTYTLNPNVSGTATVTVSVRDDGGTANGGDDTSTRPDLRHRGERR